VAKWLRRSHAEALSYLERISLSQMGDGDIDLFRGEDAGRAAPYTANGEDCFKVKYSWADRFWAIGLALDGKVEALRRIPGPADCH